jgi:hypothetical protein
MKHGLLASRRGSLARPVMIYRASLDMVMSMGVDAMICMRIVSNQMKEKRL